MLSWVSTAGVSAICLCWWEVRLLWPYYPSVSLCAAWPVRQNSTCSQQPCSWEREAFSWEPSPGINITSIYQLNKYTNLERPQWGKKKRFQEFVSNISCSWIRLPGVYWLFLLRCRWEFRYFILNPTANVCWHREHLRRLEKTLPHAKL